ncbi:Clavaminate synthase-like protein [Trametopsis cervina]|nr:Clavaminate synthase-like protein [Trametopsis cervina]
MTVALSTPHYQPAPCTKEDLDYADLTVIDLAKASTTEGRAELAILARDAMRETGFFYVVNHGLSQPETERIFDIADVPFTQVSDEEKQEYKGRMLETGSYQGYKLRKYWHIDGGVHDQVENYNINRDVSKKSHPHALRPLLPEISEFARHNHHVLHAVLRLLAVGLELHEDAFVNQHNWNAIGETYVRFMKYYPRSQEDEEKTKQVWLKGHTDFGSITVLWSQPVAALQILSPDGSWKWVRHIDNALVINAGDCMEFISGGFYKATIHRVIQPPADQRGYTRLGVFYFAIPDDNVRLVPVANSPVLEKVGVKRRFEDHQAPTAEIWRKGRTSAYGKSELKKGQESGVEEETINGVVVKHYS